MKLEKLKEIEALLMKEVVQCRHLGGYSAEAGRILILTETLFSIIQHLIENHPDYLKKEVSDRPRNKKA